MYNIATEVNSYHKNIDIKLQRHCDRNSGEQCDNKSEKLTKQHFTFCLEGCMGKPLISLKYKHRGCEGMVTTSLPVDGWLVTASGNVFVLSCMVRIPSYRLNKS